METAITRISQKSRKKQIAAVITAFAFILSAFITAEAASASRDYCYSCDRLVDVELLCPVCGYCEDCDLEMGIPHCRECSTGADCGRTGLICTDCGVCSDCGDIAACTAQAHNFDYWEYRYDYDDYGVTCYDCGETIDYNEMCGPCGRCSDCADSICPYCGWCEECDLDLDIRHCRECFAGEDCVGYFLCTECDVCYDCRNIVSCTSASHNFTDYYGYGYDYDDDYYSDFPFEFIDADRAGSHSLSFGAEHAGSNAVLVKFDFEDYSDYHYSVVSSVVVSANGGAAIIIPGAGEYLIVVLKTGDVNLSGVVDASDALEILKALSGELEFEPIQDFIASSRGDFAYSATDALNILKFITGMIDGL